MLWTTCLISEKRITFSSFVRATIACHMDFDDFPMDFQECNFVMASTNHKRPFFEIANTSVKTMGNDRLKNYA